MEDSDGGPAKNDEENIRAELTLQHQGRIPLKEMGVIPGQEET